VNEPENKKRSVIFMAFLNTMMTDGGSSGIKKKKEYTPQPVTSKKASTYDPNFGDAGLYNQSFKPEASTQIIQQQPIVAQQPDTTIQDYIKELNQAQLESQMASFNAAKVRPIRGLEKAMSKVLARID
jgi:hypothetical protein